MFDRIKKVFGWRLGFGVTELVPSAAFNEALRAAFDSKLGGHGFEAEKGLKWVRSAKPEIRDVIELYSVKGAAAAARWGVSLDFVPHVAAKRVRWHRTAKSAALDLVWDPLDFDGVDGWTQSRLVAMSDLERLAGLCSQGLSEGAVGPGAGPGGFRPPGVVSRVGRATCRPLLEGELPTKPDQRSVRPAAPRAARRVGAPSGGLLARRSRRFDPGRADGTPRRMLLGDVRSSAALGGSLGPKVAVPRRHRPRTASPFCTMAAMRSAIRSQRPGGRLWPMPSNSGRRPGGAAAAALARRWYSSAMAQPLTADDVWPLVERLPPQERLRLIRLISRSPEQDAAAYRAAPPGADEFSTHEEPLAWEAEGWEDVE